MPFSTTWRVYILPKTAVGRNATISIGKQKTDEKAISADDRYILCSSKTLKVGKCNATHVCALSHDVYDFPSNVRFRCS